MIRQARWMIFGLACATAALLPSKRSWSFAEGKVPPTRPQLAVRLFCRVAKAGQNQRPRLANNNAASHPPNQPRLTIFLQPKIIFEIPRKTAGIIARFSLGFAMGI